MKQIKMLLILFLLGTLVSCGGSLKLSTKDMLEMSGRDVLPTQADFPDDGAVVLYESSKDRLYLDSGWDVNVEEQFHQAILYFNDKAEDWTTHTIYLDPDRKLVDFQARTIKPNGEIIKLTRDDLHLTKMDNGINTFSDDQSFKFAFSGVEPGSILEYAYKVDRSGSYWGSRWYIQEDIPKLYNKYTAEIPTIFFNNDWNWTYSPANIEIGKPQIVTNMMNIDSKKDASQLFYWEVVDIPALKSEPNMPPYRDVAQFVRVDLQYDDWNDLTKKYWKWIKGYFSPSDMATYKKMALDIVGDAESEADKIARIYEYTQKKYRYLAVNIGESGWVPHTVKSIVKNKYGDCKDMSVLNVVLLRALGIEAHPALVNTKSRSRQTLDIVSLDFNHMITFAKTKDGNDYWLDATGSSCPLGENYANLEGVKALVVYQDGKSQFKKIPTTLCIENQLKRTVSITLNDDGSINGKAQLDFSGNENLGMRSYFKDASESDMKKMVERYVNANTPDLQIDSLYYDDPSDIANTFQIRFNFTKDKFGSQTGKLLIFKADIFSIDSKLDRFRDEPRKHNIQYSSPNRVSDLVKINFNPDKFDVEAVNKLVSERRSFAGFRAHASHKDDGCIEFKRDYSIKKEVIPAGEYAALRVIHKAIAASNDENIVLRIK